MTWSAELFLPGRRLWVGGADPADGELSIGRRFPLKEQAVRWAEEERAQVGDRLEDWLE